MIDLEAVLAHAVEVGASDVHLKVGSPPRVRVNGELQLTPFESIVPKWVEARLEIVMSVQRLGEFHDTGEADFSLSVKGIGRFRGIAFRQRGSAVMVLRQVLPSAVSAIDLNLPPIVTRLAEEPGGLVLVTGPTASGKTTTLAAMIDHVNQTRAANIMTIEDPIEILHPDKRSIVSQREIGTDTTNYAQAMRRVLRQDPDVILISEMSDAETVGAALTAAETGHLVLTALHTVNAIETINRLIDFFPLSQQRQARHTLAGALRGVISQRLIPRADGGQRVAAIEVLVNTSRISERIVDPGANANRSLDDLIADGEYQGMQTFNHSLFALFKSGTITMRSALAATTDPQDLRIALQAAGLLPVSEPESTRRLNGLAG